jgi:hypothetical protein
MKRPESLSTYFDTVAQDAGPPQRQPRPPGARKPRRWQVVRVSKTYELNAGLPLLVERIAAALEISPASVIDRLLYHALQAFAAGEIDFDRYLLPSRSPRYAWTVDVNPNGLQSAITAYLDDLVGAHGRAPSPSEDKDA